MVARIKVVLLVVILLVVVAILFPPFYSTGRIVRHWESGVITKVIKTPNRYYGHRYLFFTHPYYMTVTPAWELVVAEVAMIFLLGAGAVVFLSMRDQRKQKHEGGAA